MICCRTWSSRSRNSLRVKNTSPLNCCLINCHSRSMGLSSRLWAGWLAGNQVIRPVHSTGHMSPRLVKLNKCDVISQLMWEGINKLLKSLSIEARVFLTKMPAAQRFDHPVEPKIVTFPEYRCHRFHSKRHNHFPCFCFKSQAGLVLTQVTQPLSFSKQALIGQQGWGDVFLKHWSALGSCFRLTVKATCRYRPRRPDRK